MYEENDNDPLDVSLNSDNTDATYIGRMRQNLN